MTPKLQKLSAIAKPAFLFLLFLTALPAISVAQVFPSQFRVVIGGEYSFLPVPQENENVQISPNGILGITAEFKQLYALQLALQGGNVKVENSIDKVDHPTLGFTYDVILKLYRSDPPDFFTPIASLGFSKQWSLVKTEDTTVKRVMNDITDWQFKAFLGADFAIWQTFHIKALAGGSVLLATNTYYERRVFPMLRLSTEIGL